jgi:hypothetical protein
MREIEMRQRIEGFLRRRMKGMLAPALGLGLALAGCTKEVAIPVYSAPLPDGQIGPIEDAAGLTHDTPVYSAPVPPDGATADAFAAKDTLPTGTDSAPDLATVADAIVPADLLVADAALGSDAKKDTSGEAGTGVDTGAGVDVGTGADVGVDLGGFGMKYIAQLPDARPDLGMVALYMAQPPSGRS